MVISSFAASKLGDKTEADSRTYAQNYKDAMLAGCIARAYEKETLAYKDSRDTASLLMEWSNYDAENSLDEIDRIQNKYLNREYHDPLIENKDSKFELLKCFDMYHSKELNNQVQRFVSKPKDNFRKDNSKSLNISK